MLFQCERRIAEPWTHFGQRNRHPTDERDIFLRLIGSQMVCILIPRRSYFYLVYEGLLDQFSLFVGSKAYDISANLKDPVQRD
ncbi:hypothetical protein Y032_0057g2812 [Ancylostoma ceylanicum]|uniref:Uncharacterized protein n=1 Tax=Ancylostoma ceylanicum TaxID=53326 RepID=A0A016U4W1_9BILA|nr:hypothetical protein Y032_0057g2812 [Ancylostoma ceylanicum]